MHSEEKNQFTLLTSRQAAAIASLCISGPDAYGFLRRYCHSPAGDTFDIPGRFSFCRLEAGGHLIDEVVVSTLFDVPRAWEIHCHGGSAVTNAIISLLETHSFKQTNVLSHHTVLQNEATQTLLSTQSLAAASVVLAQTGSILRQWVNALVDQLLLSQENAEAVACECDTVVQHSVALAPLFKPARVVLLGRPNSGKSSLFNALCGHRQVIVSDIPGTTLDTVECLLMANDIPFLLVDTAGLRPSTDSIEQEAMRRSLLEATKADLSVEVLDASDHTPYVPITDKNKCLRVWNKVDLVRPHGVTDLAVSARTGEGVEQLRNTVSTHLVPHLPHENQVVLFTSRQLSLATEAQHALRQRKNIKAAIQHLKNLVGAP